MPTILELRSGYGDVLEEIASRLDIAPSKYIQAVRRYEAVGQWLADREYDNASEEPQVYPQGSFRLGTVVRPIKAGKDSDYDIDLVCNLMAPKGTTSPLLIKAAVGARLRESKSYRQLLDAEGRRCWSLNYAEEDGVGFHLDVLPCTGEDVASIEAITNAGVSNELAGEAIAITDRKGSGDFAWCSSNPIGFARWFESVNQKPLRLVEFASRRAILEANEALFKSVEEVPVGLVRTPLQRAIQLLKRHRDMRFAGRANEYDKPISMIITTLAARAYLDEPTTHEALVSIVRRLNEYALLTQPSGTLSEQARRLNLIQRGQNGTWRIANPVNPRENFTDRWHDNNDAKARAFFQWVTWAQRDLIDVQNKPSADQITKSLSESLGPQAVQSAVDSVMARKQTAARPIHLSSVGDKKREAPPSPWGY